MSGTRTLQAIAGGVLLTLAGATPARSAAPEELLEQVRSMTLDVEHAVAVRRISLQTAGGHLEIDDGLLFPASEVGGAVVEMVFVGDATLRFEPPDDIEAGQLELFTGQPELDEPITEAVFVMCLDDAAKALLSRPAAEGVDSGIRTRATELFESWRSSPDRKRLDVDARVLADALGDEASAAYFAGRFKSDELGEFLLIVEPEAEEQVTLGQFVRLEATKREQRKRRKYLHQQQRQGRLIGLESDDLGTWDTWMSSRLPNADGTPTPGLPGFESESYVLDVTVADNRIDLSGKARIGVTAVTGHSRVVALNMHDDLLVDSVVDASGRSLYFLQSRGNAYVYLDEAPAAGSAFDLEVTFGGVMFDRVDRGLFRMRSPVGWHPHVGQSDRATFDVTLRFPSRLDLVGSGRVVDAGGGDSDVRWERRVLERRASGFSFEIGQFEVHPVAMGDVAVKVAFDKHSSEESRFLKKDILETIGDVLAYYQEKFGDYPLDHLTIVTVPRRYSQGLLGFVTLSSLYATDLGDLEEILGIEDRRTVIAHEIAHQWWGNLVGWKGYRAQWISEAMADYAAARWAADRLATEDQPVIGPATDWMADVGAVTEDGKTIESLGPIVLGTRLNSTRSDDAYSTIVYKKGGVVLNTLRHHLGEEFFSRVLQRTVQAALDHEISTEDFLRIVEQLSGEDLDWFAQQFIYGTGLPEIYYHYDSEPKDDGGWTVRGVARYNRSFTFQLNAKRIGEGRFDVGQQAEAAGDPDGLDLVVPVQILLHDPGRRGKKRRGNRPPESNLVWTSRLRLGSPVTEFEFEVEHEPTEFWLNKDEEIFGRFFNESLNPKRVLIYQAIHSLASGQSGEAETFFRRALDAEDPEPRNATGFDRALAKLEASYLNARTQLALAWMSLDAGRIDDAREALRNVRRVPGGIGRADIKERTRILEARIDLIEGHFDRVVKRLRRGVRGRSAMRSTAGYVVLAIAAHATGDDDIFDQAARVARKRGADLSALD